MKPFLYRFALVLLLASIQACSSGRSDPFASVDNGTGNLGGQLTQGLNGPNWVVPDTARWVIAQDLIPLIFHAYELGLNTISSQPNDEDSLLTVRVNGYYFGRAEVTLNSRVVNNQGIATQTNLTLTFFNFADSATTFIGGTVDCQANVTQRFGGWYPYTLVLTGGFLFSGDYGGKVTFSSMQVPCDHRGVAYSVFATMLSMDYRPAFGSLTLASGDSIYVYNPYFRQSGPGGYIEPRPPF